MFIFITAIIAIIMLLLIICLVLIMTIISIVVGITVIIDTTANIIDTTTNTNTYTCNYIDNVIKKGLKQNGGEFDGAVFNFGGNHKIYIEGPKSSPIKFLKSIIGQNEYTIKYCIDKKEIIKIKAVGEDNVILSLKNKKIFNFKIN